jgi:hypothetical protein
MWDSLFKAIAAAFTFLTAWTRKSEPVDADAAAARAGTAAGAAADHASDTAGPTTKR